MCGVDDACSTRAENLQGAAQNKPDDLHAHLVAANVLPTPPVGQGHVDIEMRQGDRKSQGLAKAGLRHALRIELEAARGQFPHYRRSDGWPFYSRAIAQAGGENLHRFPSSSKYRLSKGNRKRNDHSAGGMTHMTGYRRVDRK